MITLSVPGIHCSGCTGRIEKALTAAGIAHTVSLEEKTVTVEEAAVPQVKEILDDLGFDAE